MNETDKTRIEKSLQALPVTRWVAEQNKGALKDTVIIHINHELEDVFAFNEVLINDLEAEVYFIAVPYYTKGQKRPDVPYYYMSSTRDGITYIPLLNGEEISDCETDTDLVTILINEIEYTLQKHVIPNLGDKKLVILQDGGYTAAMGGFIDPTDPFDDVPNFQGMVEITRSGTNLFTRKEEKHSFSYPIVAIARSKIKTQYESIFIAQRIFEELNIIFYKINDFLRFKQVILAGYGVIGRQLAQYLRNIEVEVVVYDISKRMRRLAQREGFYVTDSIDSHMIDESFCYIGCTGSASFNLQLFHEFLESDKETYYLASGSSKRIEFLPLIDFFEEEKDDFHRQVMVSNFPFLKTVQDIEVVRNDIGLEYHCTYNGKKKTIFLIADGTPVNFFNKESESVPERAIDPIQALALQSTITVAQNAKKLKKGLQLVGDEAVDKKVGIDEEQLMHIWTEKNNIKILSDNILSQFNSHPYLQSLIKIKKKS